MDHRLQIILAAKDVTKSAFLSASGQVAALTKNVFSLRGAMVAVAGATGLGLFVKKSLDLADAVGKASDVIGISTSALQEYRHAAQLSGVSTGLLDNSLKAFSKRVGEARNETGALVTFLKKFDEELLSNIQNSESTEEALDLVMTRMGQTANQTDRAALAAAAFSRSGLVLTNMVKDGAEGLDRMRQEARDLGIVMDEQLIRQSEKAVDELEKLTRVVKVQFMSAAVGLAPEIAKLAENTTNWWKANQELVKSDVAAFAGKIKDTIIEIKNIYDALPDGIIGPAGIGLIGAILLGPVGGITVGLITAVIQETSKLKRELTEIYDNVKRYLTDDSLFRGAGLTGSWGDSEENFKNIKEEIGEIQEELLELYNTEPPGDFPKFDTEKTKDAFEDMYGDLRFQSDEYYEHEKNKLTKKAEDYAQHTGDIALAHQWLTDKIKKLDEEQAEYRKKTSIETNEEANDKMLREWEHFYEKVEDYTADTLYSIFKGQIDSWKDFLDEMEDLFLRTLSQMIAQAASRRIIVPVIVSVAGTMGLGGLTGGVGGVSGGGLGPGNVGGLGNLFGFLGTPIGGVTPSAAFPGGGFAPGSAASGSLGVSGGAAGVTWGQAFGAGAISAIGYTTLGDILGLPQGRYSGVSAGGIAAAAFVLSGGNPFVAAAAAIFGGILGSKIGPAPHKPHIGTALEIAYGPEGYAPKGLAAGYSSLPGPDEYAWGKLRGKGNLNKARDAFDEVISDTVTAYSIMLNSILDEIPGLTDEILESLPDFEFFAKAHTENVADWVDETLEDLGDELSEHAGKVIGIVAPQMTQALVDEYYAAGLDKLLSPDAPIYDVAARLAELSQLGDLDPDELAEFLQTLQATSEGIAIIASAWESASWQMKIAAGEVSDYEQKFKIIQDQFLEAYKTFEKMGFSAEKLFEIWEYSVKAIIKLRKDVYESTGIQDIIDKATLTDVAYQLKQLDKWYGEQYKTVTALGMPLDELNQAYDLQKDKILDVTAALDQMVSSVEKDVGWLIAETGGTSRSEWLLQQIGLATPEGKVSLIGEWYETAVNEAIDQATRMTEALEQAADSSEQMLESIDSVIKGMTYGALNVALPSEKFAMAGTEYSALYLKATTGNEEAIREFLDFSGQYLDLAQDVYKSSPQYQTIWKSVKDDLDKLSTYAASQTYQDKIYNELMQINKGITFSPEAQTFLTTTFGQLELDFQVMIDAAAAAISAQAPVTTPGAYPDVTETFTAMDVVDYIKAGATPSYIKDYRTKHGIPLSDIVDLVNSIWGTSLTPQDALAAGYQYGGIASGPEAGYPVRLHGTEAILPLGRGNLELKINAKEIAGEIASALSSKTSSRPINVIIEVGGEQFDTHIAYVADDVRVKAERRSMGARRLYQ